jgi:hypothetical protein
MTAKLTTRRISDDYAQVFPVTLRDIWAAYATVVIEERVPVLAVAGTVTACMTVLGAPQHRLPRLGDWVELDIPRAKITLNARVLWVQEPGTTVGVRFETRLDPDLLQALLLPPY